MEEAGGGKFIRYNSPRETTYICIYHTKARESKVYQVVPTIYVCRTCRCSWGGVRGWIAEEIFLKNIPPIIMPTVFQRRTASGPGAPSLQPHVRAVGLLQRRELVDAHLPAAPPLPHDQPPRQLPHHA